MIRGVGLLRVFPGIGGLDDGVVFLGLGMSLMSVGRSIKVGWVLKLEGEIKVRFWLDDWLGAGPLSSVYPKLFRVA